jgi:UDP-arabinose 4-epimerase
MNILVTGGAGYIGSHVCKALAASGYTPIAYDNLSHGHDWAVKWGSLEFGDLLDSVALDAVIKRYQPVAVMHFAASAYVGESVSNPGKYYRNNVAGTLTLLEVMRDNNINSIVFSSTCATYGAPVHLKIAEDHPQNPINPYGMTKLVIERMLQDFDQAHGLRSISLRYFNAAGADPELEIGESHNPETHLIPMALDAASSRQSSFRLFGNDYDTPDGTCIRDFIHVSDLASAHLLALHSLKNGAPTTAYNVGTGRGYSVREVINCVESITGIHIPIEICSRRKGDPPRLISNPSLIHRELGWSAQMSDIKKIIETAWQWHLKLINT